MLYVYFIHLIMKTIIIHPKDETTDFLNDVHKDYTVFDIENNSKSKLKKAINNHEKIIMLGHGSHDGLFSSKQDRFIIDSDLVYLLREKYCVGIWCHAVDFAKKYGLKGLWTGMVISQLSEAKMLNIDTKLSDIIFSNFLFSDVIKEVENIHDKSSVSIFRQEYKMKCPVIKFNRERIYYI